MKALVPILFTREVVEAIRILLRMRSSSKISSENKYIFACGVGNARLKRMGHNTRVDEENEIKKAQSSDTNTNSKILSNCTSALRFK